MFFNNRGLSVNNQPPTQNLLGSVNDEVKKLLENVLKRDEVETLIASSTNGLSGRIQANSDTVATFDSRIKSVSNKLPDIENAIAKIPTIERGISSNMSSITSARNLLDDTIELKINPNTGSISTLNTKTNNIETYINDTLKPNITTLNTETAKISGINTRLTDTETLLGDSIRFKLDPTQTKANKNESDISSLTTRLTDTETLLADTINNVISPNVTKINSNTTSIGNLQTSKQDILNEQTDIQIRSISAQTYTNLPIDLEIRRISGRNSDGTAKLNLEFGGQSAGDGKPLAQFYLPVNIPSLNVGSVSNDNIQHLQNLSENVQERLNTLGSNTQSSLSRGQSVTFNVGRGDVYFYDDEDDRGGEGITLSNSSDTLTENGAIFSVRSTNRSRDGQTYNARNNMLWVGRDMTTPGKNIFACGFTSANGNENKLFGYATYFDKSDSFISANQKFTPNSAELFGKVILKHPGRGELEFTNHHLDRGLGSGTTLYNLGDDGDSPIFSIRSNNNTNRLWVGSSLTSTGNNDFACCYTGKDKGFENDIFSYKHLFTREGAFISGQVNVDNLIANSAQLTTFTGPARDEIDAAINSISKSQSGVITDLTVGKDGPNVKSQSIQGLTIYTSLHGPYDFIEPFDATPSVVLSGFKNNRVGRSSMLRIWTESVTSIEFTICVSDLSSSSGVEIAWHANLDR